MAVGYSMSIFTLEKIVETMYYARRIFDIDPYTKDIMQHIPFSSEYSGRNQVGRRLPMHHPYEWK